MRERLVVTIADDADPEGVTFDGETGVRAAREAMMANLGPHCLDVEWDIESANAESEPSNPDIETGDDGGGETPAEAVANTVADMARVMIVNYYPGESQFAVSGHDTISVTLKEDISDDVGGVMAEHGFRFCDAAIARRTLSADRVRVTFVRE